MAVGEHGNSSARDSSVTPPLAARHMATAASRLRHLTLLALTLALAACADHWVEGEAARQAGDWEQALAHYERVPTTHEFYVEAHDLLPEIRFQSGRAAYEDGRWRDAVDHLRRLREHQTHFAEAQNLIGCSFYQMGKDAFERGDFAEAERLAAMVRAQCTHFEAARVLASQAHEKVQEKTQG